MSWQEFVAVVVVLLGFGAGAFLVAQQPCFWLEFGVRIGQAVPPRVLKYVSRRMPPQEEAAWREAERRGQGEEWRKEKQPGRCGLEVIC